MGTFEPAYADPVRGAAIVDAVLAHRYARAVVREIRRDSPAWQPVVSTLHPSASAPTRMTGSGEART